MQAIPTRILNSCKGFASHYLILVAAAQQVEYFMPDTLPVAGLQHVRRPRREAFIYGTKVPLMLSTLCMFILYHHL